MDKSQKLVQQITPLFLEKGYWNLRVDDIAKELNISKKTLYVYFDNKKDIIWQVIENKLQTIEEIAKQATAEKSNALEALVKCLVDFYEFIGKEQDKRNLEELKKYYPEILQKYRLSILKLIRNIIKENYKIGIQEGLYIADFEPEYVGRYFSVIYLANRTMAIANDNPYDFNQLRITSVKIALGGIVTDKGRQLLKEIDFTFN